MIETQNTTSQRPWGYKCTLTMFEAERLLQWCRWYLMLRIAVLDDVTLEVPGRDGFEYIWRPGWADFVERITGKSLMTFGTPARKVDPATDRQDREAKLRVWVPRLRRRSRFLQIRHILKNESNPAAFLKPIDPHALGRFVRYGEPLSPHAARSLVARMLADEAITDQTVYVLEDYFMPDLTSECEIVAEDGSRVSMLEYQLSEWKGERYAPEKRKANALRPKLRKRDSV